MLNFFILFIFTFMATTYTMDDSKKMFAEPIKEWRAFSGNKDFIPVVQQGLIIFNGNVHLTIRELQGATKIATDQVELNAWSGVTKNGALENYIDTNSNTLYVTAGQIWQHAIIHANGKVIINAQDPISGTVAMFVNNLSASTYDNRLLDDKQIYCYTPAASEKSYSK